MEVGTKVVTEVDLWCIVYHSGDSAYRHEEYYFSKRSAVTGSVLRGVEQEPVKVQALRLSNGSYIAVPKALQMGSEPTQEQLEKVVNQALKSASPAVKALLLEK